MFITESDFINTILEAGVDNVIFMCKVPMIEKIMGISIVSSDSPEILVPCTINEDRYKVSDGYKITLVPMYENFSKEHYYISDLKQIVQEGNIQMYVQQFKKI